MGLKAAVQALKKAEPLKDKVQRCKDLLNDNDAWICQQQLQKIYQQVLILDLEYALDKKVEQELWNLGFKNYIVTLQLQAKDRKNPKRCESQALLGWCLEAASGFYLTLLQEICTAFDLDLPFRRKGYLYGCNSSWKAVKKLSPPHKSSCFYACQYCLVHLGDIARYRNESRQAELFYRHAVSLSPSSGQPYNQLALLEASRGDKLATVFHYARSVTVKHPFPVASANLAKTLSSVLNDTSLSIEGKTKLNSQEYITVFLKFHSILHNFGDLQIASSYVKLLTQTLTALVATGSFTSWKLVQMFVINLYALQHTVGNTMDSTEVIKSEQLSYDEKISRDYILDLIAGSLSALLLPVYTFKNSIIEYFALPSVKLCLDWIHLEPKILEETAFTSRLEIWPSLCVMLNALQDCVMDFEYEKYTKIPLPEDRDLQGFLPLEKNFETLKFNNLYLEIDGPIINKLRAVRILQLGRSFIEHRANGSAMIPLEIQKTDDRQFIFVSQGDGPSNELMKELEELSLNKEQPAMASSSPVPSESISSKESIEADSLDNILEKKMGILKPQGTLERNRDSFVNVIENNIVESNLIPSVRKTRQNIAMQTIIRRAENEQKQVTFKNISPVVTEEHNERKLSSTKNEPNQEQLYPLAIIDNTTTSKSIKPPNKQSQVPRMPQFLQQNSYQDQLQNSQFPKNFMKNQTTDVSQYQINDQSNIPAVQQHNRALPQRVAMLQQQSNYQSPDPNTYTSYLNNIQQITPMPSTTKPQINFNQMCGPNNSSVYNKDSSSSLEFPFLQQANPSKNQEQSMNGYQMFQGHQVGDFGLWKEHPLPQPPITWWGTASNDNTTNGTTSGTRKESPSTNSFLNWPSSPSSGNFVGRISLSSEDSYQNQLQERNFNNRNDFDDSQVFQVDEKPSHSPNIGNTYSLFSGNTWNSQTLNGSHQDKMKSRLNQQSLWSGPGPSPLERLLEQQKSLREGGT